MVVILGIFIVLAGAAAAFLPPVTVSVWPWAIAFIIALAYPLVLYPMLKERRADYEFRALHFAPALMLLVWVALDLLSTFRPQWQVLQSLYTWGWALGVVAAAFILLVLFCLRVIRQRWSRLGMLAMVFLAFLGVSQISEQKNWDSELAMVLWDGESTGSGSIAGGSSSNLSPSTDSQEEQWREQLRQMERRRQQIANGTGAVVSSKSSSSASSVIIAAANSSHSAATGTGTVSPPPRLTSSGFGIETLGVLMAAGYCSVLHRKSMKRARQA